MASFKLDISSLVKRCRKEEGSDFIIQLYNRIEKTKERLLTSYLSVIEYSSTMMRLHRERLLSYEEATGLMDLFRRESEQHVGYWPVSQPLLYEALRLVIDHPLKTPDAIQLASAMEAHQFLKPTQKNFYFVANDNMLCKTTEKEGLNVLRPRDKNAMEILSSLE